METINSRMRAVVLISSFLAAASASPFIVNVNGVYLPQQYGAAPYPTAYGYAAGPAHAFHTTQAVRTAPVAAVKSIAAVPIAAAVPAVAVDFAKAAPVAAVAVEAVPTAHAAPAVQSVTSSQYHAQDEAGNYKYGYKNINSAKEAAGNVHDHYEAGYYTDHARTVQYVADVNGFRHV